MGKVEDECEEGIPCDKRPAGFRGLPGAGAHQTPQRPRGERIPSSARRSSRQISLAAGRRGEARGCGSTWPTEAVSRDPPPRTSARGKAELRRRGAAVSNGTQGTGVYSWDLFLGEEGIWVSWNN